MSGQRTAVVTGATGFLGLNLVQQLTADGWRVIALRRENLRHDDLDRFDCEQAVGDILDEESIEAAIPLGCDAVFHTAANTSVWRRQEAMQSRVNVDGTAHVVEAVLRRGARRLIHVSTWNVYDWSSGVVSEETPKTGGSSWIPYVRSKHEAEEVVLEAVRHQGLDAVIVNPSHIVGRYDRQNWAQLIMMTATGTLPGVPSGAGCFAHGQAVAKAMIAAVDRGRCGENYLLGGPHATFLEFVQTVARMAHQTKVPKRPIPTVLMKLMARIETFMTWMSGKPPQITPEAVEMVTGRARIESTKARDELGYEPPSLEFAIRDAYDWMLREKMIFAYGRAPRVKPGARR
ncbi:MAG: NAD-dependent epimerase/dehydratase family protein [Pseudomonadota bacterium]|nr:NAD-dependent epimerase/dehydratase family protein [Pseudomonadota bacterium]